MKAFVQAKDRMMTNPTDKTAAETFLSYSSLLRDTTFLNELPLSQSENEQSENEQSENEQSSQRKKMMFQTTESIFNSRALLENLLMSTSTQANNEQRSEPNVLQVDLMTLSSNTMLSRNPDAYITQSDFSKDFQSLFLSTNLSHQEAKFFDTVTSSIPCLPQDHFDSKAWGIGDQQPLEMEVDVEAVKSQFLVPSNILPSRITALQSRDNIAFQRNGFDFNAYHDSLLRQPFREQSQIQAKEMKKDEVDNESPLPTQQNQLMHSKHKAKAPSRKTSTKTEKHRPKKGKSTSTSKKKKKKRIRKRPNYEPEVKDYTEPTDNDVLLGRGGRTNHHVGNKKYLEAKTEIQPRYLDASKEEKTLISQELVDAVHDWGGRFLKLDRETGMWYKIKEIAARKKASQTLRELNTPENRAEKRKKYGLEARQKNRKKA